MAAIGPALPTAATLVGLTALLIAKRVRSQPGIWIAKPIAALGFVTLALTVGALDTPYGVTILIGLVLSMAGDILLIPENNPTAFKAGLGSFLLGHVAYAVAFVSLGVDWLSVAEASAVALAIAWPVLRWLMPHVGSSMRVPVLAYIVVISCMLVASVGCAVEFSRPDIFLGALLFYLSDFAVARDKFVSPGFWNGAWGLPFYFVAQLILAYGTGQ